MNNSDTGSERIDTLVARAVVARALSYAWRDPTSRPDVALATADLDALREAWNRICMGCADLEGPQLSIGELAPKRAFLEPVIEWFGAPRAARMAAYDHVFGLATSKDCPPYETDYCHWEDPTYRASQLADVAGFYRAFGVEPGGHPPERPDHIANEIEFVSLLYQKSAIALGAADTEHGRICAEAREAFVRDHAAWWMPTCARCVQRRITRQSSANRTAVTPIALLAALDGIAELLRAWTAVMRTDAGLAPSPEVVAPSPPVFRPEEMEDACVSCCGLHAGNTSDCTH